jgi:hypothetical protein
MTDGTTRQNRRRILLNAGLAAMAAPVAAAGLSRTAAAQQKLAPNLVQYVANTPDPAKRCDNCLHWQPPNACAIVDGPIAPAGWCAVWAPKG